MELQSFLRPYYFQGMTSDVLQGMTSDVLQFI